MDEENGIDGILTGFTDSYLLPYQHLCELTNRPCYGTKEQFELFTNKRKYKQLCREYSVPTIEEYMDIDTTVRYPVIVKPVDGSGSRGIEICNDKKELSDALEHSKQSSRQGEVVVERYMDCPEATVFWLFDDGNYYLTMIGNRHVKHNQEGNVIPLPVGYTFPSYLTPKYIKDVEKNAKRMFRAVGVKNGLMFMQCKVEDGTCFVYDIGFRLTGSREYLIQGKACGYDPLEMLIHFAVSGRMSDSSIEEKINPCKMPPSFNVSCLSGPGTIKAIGGLDEVRNMPEVIDVACAHLPGFTISESMKGHLAQITVRVLGSVSNKDELFPVMDKIQSLITITSSLGTDLLLPGIEKMDIQDKVL